MADELDMRLIWTKCPHCKVKSQEFMNCDGAIKCSQCRGFYQKFNMEKYYVR